MLDVRVLCIYDIFFVLESVSIWQTNSNFSKNSILSLLLNVLWTPLHIHGRLNNSRYLYTIYITNFIQFNANSSGDTKQPPYDKYNSILTYQFCCIVASNKFLVYKPSICNIRWIRIGTTHKSYVTTFWNSSSIQWIFANYRNWNFWRIFDLQKL